MSKAPLQHTRFFSILVRCSYDEPYCRTPRRCVSVSASDAGHVREKTRVRGSREAGAATFFAPSTGGSAGPRGMIDDFDAPMGSHCPYLYG